MSATPKASDRGATDAGRRGTSARQRTVLRQDSTGARTAIVLNGVPEELVCAAERREDIDWRPLAGALDSLFMATGGDRGVRVFWQTPRIDLEGKTPLDFFSCADGPIKLEQLVREVTRRTQLAKLR